MSTSDYVIQFLMTVFLIFGGYQFYFWCQRNPLTETRRLETPWDERIPFWPSWTWVYGFLYYPAIAYLNWTVSSPRHFNHVVMSFFVLLALQMIFFVLFPVETPPHWRAINRGRSLAERLLRFMHRFDAPSNCFPSMHVSVATLTALHAHASLGAAALLFPVLIALSCVFTKQHYVADLPAGAGLGWCAYGVYQWLN
jgi:membrane-associated phospholipid phosphatase